MKRRPLRQIILTHWNAGVFNSATASHLIPELVVYSLLYDEVLIREEDLLTNRHIVRLLDQPTERRIFEEFLTEGLVKLLRLPLSAYPFGRKYDPERLPLSARVEEHEIRRSYKGKPWRATSNDWRVFRSLDRIIVDNPIASRFHAPFPSENPFAEQLGKLLEERHDFHLNSNPSFRHIDPKTADKFIEFCRKPEAWLRFLKDAGAKKVITGPDGGFYRSAAYQCSYFLPTPRPIQRLVESVYAATYCYRERAEGRYDSTLIELPYRYTSEAKRENAVETITRLEIVPTGATASIPVCPGIATVIVRTRQSAAFDQLQWTINQLGNADPILFPTEKAFRDAWYQICAEYATQVGPLLVALGQPAGDKIPRYTAVLYLLARVLGFLVLPESPWHTHPEVALDHVVIAGLEHLGPKLLNGFRAALGAPRLMAAMAGAVRVRSSKVVLNKLQTLPKVKP